MTQSLAKVACVFLVAVALGSSVARATTITFGFTGAPQSVIVPSNVFTITLEVWGAQGWSGNNPGGKGGYAIGDLLTTPGETLWIYVGGQGTVASVANTPMGGGFNGGGNGQSNYSGLSNSVGGGGGGTDIRQGGTALANRMIVAGGGGGATNNTGAFGGNGGGLVGQNGGTHSIYPGGTGGTQTSGGSSGGALGQGGNALAGMTPWNGGGGGGYYGGGVSPAHAGGGGGSSYIGGVLNALTQGGIQTGNGFARLTFEPVPEPSTLALAGLGLFGLVAYGWRRRKQVTAAD